MNDGRGPVGTRQRDLHPRCSSTTDDVVERLRDGQVLSALVGRAPVFRRAIADLTAIARSGKSVMVTGETGTGKEIVARALHYLSDRAANPFVPVNCGALPETLLEDELFGHERGAFTDARASRPGLLAEARKGSIFLDEVDTLSPHAQVALLRVLQDQRYRPVGGTFDREADVRILAATNARMEQRVVVGAFRADLFYRLCIFSIHLPPLRERKEDIPDLADHFLAKHAIAGGFRFTESACAAMAAFDWPGNVRELENAVIRGCHLSRDGSIGYEQLSLPPAPLTNAAVNTTPKHPVTEPMQALKRKVINDFERRYLVEVLAAHCGNVTQAARYAQKDRRELGKLLKKHGIHPDQFTSGQKTARASFPG
jgi:DNA-binding NtrC family response regulator